MTEYTINTSEGANSPENTAVYAAVYEAIDPTWASVSSEGNDPKAPTDSDIPFEVQHLASLKSQIMSLEETPNSEANIEALKQEFNTAVYNMDANQLKIVSDYVEPDGLLDNVAEVAAEVAEVAGQAVETVGNFFFSPPPYEP